MRISGGYCVDAPSSSIIGVVYMLVDFAVGLGKADHECALGSALRG